MAGKKSLLKVLGPSLMGATLDPETGLIGRRFERTQGCWNCIHGDFDGGKDYWKAKRQQDLQIAATKALESPLGEEEPVVKNIRRMVDAIDVGLATGNLIQCRGHKGRDANGNPVGDFCKSNYLCDQWSGKQGASVARDVGKSDPLPMELEDKTPQGRN